MNNKCPVQGKMLSGMSQGKVLLPKLQQLQRRNRLRKAVQGTAAVAETEQPGAWVIQLEEVAMGANLETRIALVVLLLAMVAAPWLAVVWLLAKQPNL